MMSLSLPVSAGPDQRPPQWVLAGAVTDGVSGGSSLLAAPDRQLFLGRAENSYLVWIGRSQELVPSERTRKELFFLGSSDLALTLAQEDELADGLSICF